MKRGVRRCKSADETDLLQMMIMEEDAFDKKKNDNDDPTDTVKSQSRFRKNSNDPSSRRSALQRRSSMHRINSKDFDASNGGLSNNSPEGSSNTPEAFETENDAQNNDGPAGRSRAGRLQRSRSSNRLGNNSRDRSRSASRTRGNARRSALQRRASQVNVFTQDDVETSDAAATNTIPSNSSSGGNRRRPELARQGSMAARRPQKSLDSSSSHNNSYKSHTVWNIHQTKEQSWRSWGQI